jgi:hypothetical protein
MGGRGRPPLRDLGMGEGGCPYATLDGRGARPHTTLSHRFFYSRDPVRPLQHFPRLRPVGGAPNRVLKYLMQCDILYDVT